MFSERLKELRVLNGFTQNELAEQLCISRSALSLYELGKRTPDFETLQKICDVLNVTADYLINNVSDLPISPLNLSEDEIELINRHRSKGDPLEHIFYTDLEWQDKFDIAKDIQGIMSKINLCEDNPVYYNGQKLSETDKELFKDALEFALKRIKLENKLMHTPSTNHK